ncbi:biogenesis of lysosome-related organelles complex 1 subunit 4-like isoform X1 [Lampetra fluviatilis]
MAERAARGFGEALAVETHGEAAQLHHSIDTMLTRLEEFCSMLDMMRRDSSQVVSTSLPEILEQAAAMTTIFHRVDQLEAFVRLVGRDVQAMEDAVVAAEREQGSLPHSMTKFFRSISMPSFLSKSSGPDEASAPTSSPSIPAVFHTEDFIKCQETACWPEDLGLNDMRDSN